MAVARPRLATRPCPACGSAVDPLRAPVAIALADGIRLLCSERCRRDFILGVRAHRVEQAAPMPATTSPAPASLLGPRALLRRLTPRASAAVRQPQGLVRGRPSELTPSTFPTPPLALALSGLFVGSLPGPGVLAWLAWICAVTTVLPSLFAAARSSRRDGRSSRLAAPIGAALVCLGAIPVDPSAPRGLAALAALAAASVPLRAWLETRSQLPLRLALGRFEQGLPTVARRAADGNEAVPTTEVGRLRTGDEIVVREGETVPADGIVLDGEARVVPWPDASGSLNRRPGDPMVAGARLVDGWVRLLVSRTAESRALALRTRLEAEMRRGEPGGMGRLLTRVSVLFGAVGTTVCAIAASWHVGLDGGLLTAGALTLSLPWRALRAASDGPRTAAFAGGARRGILFGTAQVLDLAGRTATVVLSARGAITDGEPHVVDVVPVGDEDAARIVAIAAGAEAAAEAHPIGRAIRRYASRLRCTPVEMRRSVALPGRGVVAWTASGEPVLVGNRRLLLDEGVAVARAEDAATQAERRGHPYVFVAVGGRVRAVIVLEESTRPGGRAAVQRLNDMRLEVVMLSGDHRATAESLARALDVSHVRAEVVPEERAAEIRRLREAGAVVACIGRPGSDDAMLDAADVPVALGMAGAQGTERAIALVSDDLRDAVAALWIARATRLEVLRGIGVSCGATALAFALLAAGAWSVPLAAVAGLAADGYVLPTGARLLERIERRWPARS
ncbi:MAG: HAD-IC family P-type ATPase [Myxococcota bacterium]|nr:HAD-IC family P-type ATPase [Myxococcota bacterium]